MPPDAGLTFSNLELIEMYRWVAEAFGMTFDVGSSQWKCKVDDLSLTTTPEVKKSCESICADVVNEGKAGEIVEGDLNMKGEVDELQDNQGIVKVVKVKVKTGKKSSKDKVKKEKQKLKRQGKEKETGKGNERKEEVIVELETDDAGEGVIKEDNGSCNDLDVEDVKDVERAQLKGKEKEKEKEKREEVKKEEKEEKRMVKVEGKGKAKEIRVSVNCPTRRSARNSSKHTVIYNLKLYNMIIQPLQLSSMAHLTSERVLRFNLMRVEIRELRPKVIAESDEVLVHYRSRTNV